MVQIQRSRVLIAIPILTLAGCSDFTQTEATDLSSPANEPETSTCSTSAVESWALHGVAATAEQVPSGTAMPTAPGLGLPGAPFPAHCMIRGSIDRRTGVGGRNYAIGFELRLPDESWNEKFFFQGGGGTDGVLLPALGEMRNTSVLALSLGYAVVSTDAGHDTGRDDVSFGLDPQARIDYGYNAIGRTTEVAKQLLVHYYGNAPSRSYFLGCSNGGRQALVAASRFPEQFDGIAAGAPGLQLPRAAMAQAWDLQQWMTVTTAGQLPTDAFPPQVLETVAAGLLNQCDGLDGLEDGIVHDWQGCQAAFSLDDDVATCEASGTVDCLNSSQKVALQAVFGGAKTSTGGSVYADWPWDAGLVGSDWRFWRLDASPIGLPPLPLSTLVGAGALGYVFTTPPDAPDLSDGGVSYQLGFDFDSGVGKIVATSPQFAESAIDFMEPTSLRAFANAGGKLIVYHGSSDPVFSANQTVSWYEAQLGADPDLSSHARLFLVPGMNHCAGGPATERFDVLQALDDWVEAGQVPDSIPAGVDPNNLDLVNRGWPTERMRPLCAYPKHAVAPANANDTEVVGSFECQ